MNHDQLSMLELIDAFLEDTLEQPQRAAFEAAMAQSAELRTRVQQAADLNGRIDAALVRSFGPNAIASPSASASDSSSNSTTTTTAPNLAIRRKKLQTVLAGIAALLAIAASASFIYISNTGGLESDGPPLRSPRQAYASIAMSNFQPAEVCTTPEAFAEWTSKKFNATLRPKPTSTSTPTSTPSATPPTLANVQYVGWSYARVVTDYSGVLIAKANGQDVIVIIDRADFETTPAKDCKTRPSKPGQQHVFRSTIGRFVLYEVTPLDQPLVSQSLEAGD